MIINDFELSQRENRESIGMGVYLAPSILVSPNNQNKILLFKFWSQDHSCQPNAWVEFEGNKLVLRSKCDQEKPDMSKVFIVSSDQLSGSKYFWNIPQIFSWCIFVYFGSTLLFIWTCSSQVFISYLDSRQPKAVRQQYLRRSISCNYTYMPYSFWKLIIHLIRWFSFVAGTISFNVAVIAVIMKYNFNKPQHCSHDLIAFQKKPQLQHYKQFRLMSWYIQYSFQTVWTRQWQNVINKPIPALLTLLQHVSMNMRLVCKIKVVFTFSQFLATYLGRATCLVLQCSDITRGVWPNG